MYLAQQADPIESRTTGAAVVTTIVLQYPTYLVVL